MMRIGIGYDLHQLEPGRPLILGGVHIPHDRGLAGYSDADALCHAITDALLGALALGDIGTHFPDNDPQYQGIDSTKLLAVAAAMVREAGYRVVNVDSVVIAQRPRLRPHADAIRGRLAEVLGIPAEVVSVKAKTNEGVGAEGREEAISTQAVVLLERG